jgi:putative ABC transport system ATP-binding protein
MLTMPELNLTNPPEVRALLRLANVTKVYGSGETAVQALGGITLEIAKGEYCAIMGPSGSGKSTAMNMLGCLDRPTSGSYFLDGQDVARLSERELAIVRNQKIGFVFQQFHLLPQLTALENVMLPMVYGGVKPQERKERAMHALEQVGLGNRLHNRPNQLSGGQQQRVAIARAIVNHPILLLADEPTGALDTRTTQEILHIFKELNLQGMTVVMVTHEPEVAKQTDRIIWFQDGKVANDSLRPTDLGSIL